MVADNFKIRASMAHKIMTPPKAGSKEALSETAKSYLKLWRRLTTWDRTKEFSTKYTEKGNITENAAITLYSRIKKKYFVKNTERLENDYCTGTPDATFGNNVIGAKEGFDVKSSWDLSTFPFPTDKLDKSYYWQNMTYMALTGAETWHTAFCLINTPSGMIDDEKRKWQYKLGVIDPDADPTFKEKCKEIERNMIFDLGEFREVYPFYPLEWDDADWTFDIPMHQRVVEFTVHRDNEEIKSLYQKIALCRQWMRENLEGVI